ncbi:ABC transporter permease [Gracilibacillus alcaliphilus]|uniref:ABC transporter permease n=1 Tax=Gracilibacillus alcaliphilus TaxID=1401441 RepID=UPI00195D3BB2|nr:ABC transporter permease [Gracilibacillus alcaliphilus]MBM7677517.1 NitT/TauT family transport system permease protein [Gracilibacillus alcaliphilus]
MKLAKQTKSLLLKVVVPVTFILLWELLSRANLISSALLPAPSSIIAAMIDWIFGTTGLVESNSGQWLVDAGNSALRVLIGYSIATVTAIVMGILIGWWKPIEQLVEPTIQMLRPIPPVAWIPLAIIWFGIADKPAIFLVFLAAFFPILVNTIHGVKSVDKNLVRAGGMMGANQWHTLRYVILPAALPNIMAGMRIGIGAAWMLTVTAEMVAVNSGLGYVLWDSYYFLRYDLVIASMISIGLLGFLTDFAIKKAMHALLPWQRGASIESI